MQGCVAGVGAVFAFVVAAHAGLPGELVVVIASKGQFKGEPDFQGMDALAESAHRHGHPVTWFLKPVTVGPASERLKTVEESVRR
jgi:hypothetical protein